MTVSPRRDRLLRVFFILVAPWNLQQEVDLQARYCRPSPFSGDVCATSLGVKAGFLSSRIWVCRNVNPQTKRGVSRRAPLWLTLLPGGCKQLGQCVADDRKSKSGRSFSRFHTTPNCDRYGNACDLRSSPLGNPLNKKDIGIAIQQSCLIATTHAKHEPCSGWTRSTAGLMVNANPAIGTDQLPQFVKIPTAISAHM